MQGALGSLTSITAIIGPVLFLYLFRYFTAPTAPVVFAGAPFIMSAILILLAVIVFVAKVHKDELKAVAEPSVQEVA